MGSAGTMMYWNAVPNRTQEVYSIDGHLVGTVADAWPESYTSNSRLAQMIGEEGEGYFQLTGFTGGDLNVTRKQLGQQGWDERPAYLSARH